MKTGKLLEKINYLLNNGDSRKKYRNYVLKIISKYDGIDTPIPYQEALNIILDGILLREVNYLKTFIKKCGDRIDPKFLQTAQDYIKEYESLTEQDIQQVDIKPKKQTYVDDVTAKLPFFLKDDVSKK